MLKRSLANMYASIFALHLAVSMSVYICIYEIHTHIFIPQPLTPIQHHRVDSSTPSFFGSSFSFSQREISLIAYNLFTYLINPSIHVN